MVGRFNRSCSRGSIAFTASSRRYSHVIHTDLLAKMCRTCHQCRLSHTSTYDQTPARSQALNCCATKTAVDVCCPNSRTKLDTHCPGVTSNETGFDTETNGLHGNEPGGIGPSGQQHPGTINTSCCITYILPFRQETPSPRYRHPMANSNP